MFNILKKLHGLHNDLPFLPEKMKIEKVENLVTNLHDKTEYVLHILHIRNLKQALSHGLTLKKVQRVFKFNQNALLKPYNDMNRKLRQKAKNNFEKDFFRLMNSVVSGKTMENERKHRNIELVKTERGRNYLVSEPNYHITMLFTEYVLAIELRKIQILINKPVYLGLSILDLSKSVMYEFWYYYVKPKYGEHAKLCYMDKDSFIEHVQAHEIYKDIGKDVETLNFEIDKPLPKGKNKKVIRLMKDELDGKIKK